MGAALYGAGLSRQFKTKDVRLQGVAPYAIEVAHEIDAKGSGASSLFEREHELKTDAEPAKQVKTSIFPANARAGVKKTLNMKKLVDFSVLFRYPSPPASSVPSPFSPPSTGPLTGMQRSGRDPRSFGHRPGLRPHEPHQLDRHRLHHLPKRHGQALRPTLRIRHPLGPRRFGRPAHGQSR